MRFILVSPKNRTAYNFRGDLIKRIISCGYEVIVTGPNRVGVEKIEALGARFVEIPMNKKRSKSEGGPEISKGSLRAV